MHLTILYDGLQAAVRGLCFWCHLVVKILQTGNVETLMKQLKFLFLNFCLHFLALADGLLRTSVQNCLVSRLH